MQNLQQADLFIEIAAHSAHECTDQIALFPAKILVVDSILRTECVDSGIGIAGDGRMRVCKDLPAHRRKTY